ncbi:hypothetical protein [Micromonospora psammae]|uniref:hypothetical protein n=1 Tax=Micromonospora sp. CPCC 205556 TaxID=3122398 RepID=UPI002FF01BB8
MMLTMCRRGSGRRVCRLGCEGAVAFELVDAALDGVTLPVDVASKRGDRPPWGSFSRRLAAWSVLTKDGRGDASAGEMLPVGAEAVGLVGQDPPLVGYGAAATTGTLVAWDARRADVRIVPYHPPVGRTGPERRQELLGPGWRD